MSNDHEAYSRIICSLVELEYMQQALDNQDEQDKHGINLFGLSETNMTIQDLLQKGAFKDLYSKRQNLKAESAAFQVQQNCLSCQDEEFGRARVMKAFKLACLSYKSQEVAFRGMNFTRRMLFEMRRKLIDDEWSKMLA